MLQNITPYIYGTTRLGDDNIPEKERIAIALKAMASGVWFHTSHQYNSALSVLSKAFKQAADPVPKLIVKLGGDSVKAFREEIKLHCTTLGVDQLHVGQLCVGGELARELGNGGDFYNELEKIKAEGLVNHFVYEVFPWTSELPYQALLNGYSNELIDAHIFYLNPLQRFASNKLWNLLQEKQKPIIAMRTVSGGPVHMLRDVPGFAWKDYLRKRAIEVAPVFEQSGITNWTEFCVRFAHSIPGVLATVGATSKAKNLDEFLAAKDNIKPLPKEIVEAIAKLQHRWSDELDIHAEPWSM